MPLPLSLSTCRRSSPNLPVCACTSCRHLGSGGTNRGTAVDVDYGGASFEVAQLDGVLDL
jgi:hypothetical protein